jgi:hypothetical protein
MGFYDPELLAVLQRKAADLRAHLQKVEAMIAEFGGSSSNDAIRLPTGAQHENVSGMDDAHRASLSEAKANDPLSIAVRAAGFPSVNKFGEHIGLTATFLRDAHKGKKAIRETVAKRIGEALGNTDNGAPRFPAVKDNWPKIKIGK